jgi:cytochrome c oxidase subunit 2
VIDPRLVVAFGLPPDASAEGWRIDALFSSALWLTCAVALAALAWLGWMLVRGRRRSIVAQASVAHASRRPAVLPAVLTTLVFVAVDGTLLVGSTRDVEDVFGRAGEMEREPGAVRVEVDGHQWSWGFRLAGPDGVFATADDVVTLDRLVVPRGRAVVLEVSSTDVVHALYLPALRVKLDAVPGRVARTWFRPALVGRFEIGCAQFCGVGHHQMRGAIEVLEPAAFDAWLVGAVGEARRIDAEDRRAQADEPDRLADPMWPRFSPIDPAGARDWGWPWGRR